MGLVVQEGGAHQLDLAGSVEAVDQDEVGEHLDIPQDLLKLGVDLHLSLGLERQSALDGGLVLS